MKSLPPIVFFASLLALVVVIFIIFGVVGSKSARNRSSRTIPTSSSTSTGNPHTTLRRIMERSSEETPRRSTGSYRTSRKAAADSASRRHRQGLELEHARHGHGRGDRGALKKVRESGKPVYAFGDTFDRKTVYSRVRLRLDFMPPAVTWSSRGWEGRLTLSRRRSTNSHQTQPPPDPRVQERGGEMTAPRAPRGARDAAVDGGRDVGHADRSHLRGPEALRGEDRRAHAARAFHAEGSAEAGLIDRSSTGTSSKNRLKATRREAPDRHAIELRQDRPGKVGLKGKKKIAVVHAHG